jgi:hypothetical protein
VPSIELESVMAGGCCVVGLSFPQEVDRADQDQFAEKIEFVHKRKYVIKRGGLHSMVAFARIDRYSFRSEIPTTFSPLAAYGHKEPPGGELKQKEIAVQGAVILIKPCKSVI